MKKAMLAHMPTLTVLRMQLQKANTILLKNDEDPIIETIDQSKPSCLYTKLFDLLSLISRANQKLKDIGEKPIHPRPRAALLPKPEERPPENTRWSIQGFNNKYYNDHKRPSGFYDVIFAYPEIILAKDDDDKKKMENVHIVAEEKIKKMQITDEDHFLYWDNYECRWKTLHENTNPWQLSDCQCKYYYECQKIIEFDNIIKKYK